MNQKEIEALQKIKEALSGMTAEEKSDFLIEAEARRKKHETAGNDRN